MIVCLSVAHLLRRKFAQLAANLHYYNWRVNYNHDDHVQVDNDPDDGNADIRLILMIDQDHRQSNDRVDWLSE